MFKETFKYYKQKKPPPSFQEVIDIERPEEFNRQIKKINANHEHSKHQSNWLIPFEEWKIYEFIGNEGLIIISNPFTSFGQRFWIKTCLQDFPKKPNKLNIDAHGDILDGQIWWNKCMSNSETKKDLIKKLRWVTLGYHHNWDTKVYNEDDYTEMPTDICNLCSIISNFLGFSNFKAQAAIINFYHEGCTLAPHTDHSESFLNAPLISISFGRPAIFLIGGLTLEEKPSSILLKSGDVLIMSGKSRLSYHAIPRILTDSENTCKDIIPWKSENVDKDWKPFDEYITNSRINLNIRQVHEIC